MNSSSNGLIRAVAVFKLFKAALLIATGIGILKLVHADVADQLDHWIRMLGFDPGSRYLDHAIQRITNTPPQKFRELGFGSFIYAALFLTEGIGLWLLKRWAEWFTVIITGSLVPLEAYETYRHPTAIKFLVLILNIAIVVYLLYHVTHEQRRTSSPKSPALVPGA
jgi:uncharacterized membrane protein (DUF2068 family)